MGRFERAYCRSAPWRFFARRLVLPWALQGARLRGDVLEIGGGSGAMAAGILDAFPDTRVVMTDVDPSMVDAARRRLDVYGQRTAVQGADATSLPYGDASFDAVASFIMLHHVVHWEQALGEAARVLRPGGVVVGYDLVASRPARWLHQVQRERQRMVGIAELEERLSALPFSDVRVAPGLGGLTMRFRAVRI